MTWNEEATIRCAFRFKCPKLWDRLQPTEADGVRHCPECRRDVLLALTEETFRQHSDEGRCIAVPVWRNNPENDPNDPDDPNDPIYWVGEVIAPYAPFKSPLKRV